MAEPSGIGEIMAGGRIWRFQHVSIGNPQCAIHVETIDELMALDISAIGPEIEASEDFPNRTNVSWYTEIEPNRIRARIFERGVGGDTVLRHGSHRRRCGPPSLASNGAAGASIVVALDGGELEVEVGEDLHINLTGWARPVFAGTLSEDFLKELTTPECMKPSERLSRIPPYLFAELERKIAAKKAAGVDVISLGIGDPDRPTPALIVEAMQEAVSEPETHRYPSNRGRHDFRVALSDFYERRFDVDMDAETEVIPAIGAKEAIFNLNLAFLDPGDVALASDPGYPVYTGGPLLAGAEPVVTPLVPELGFVPDLDAISEETARRAKLMYLNYPNNPTGAIVPEGFFERIVAYARAYYILVVHDNAYSETTYDGYRAPSFLATPGAKDVGIEVFSLSKGYNMTGWRCAAVLGNAAAIEQLLALEDQHRQRPVRGGAARRGGGALARLRRRGGLR